MALFSSNGYTRNPVRPRFQPARALPDLARLRVICRASAAHFLPVEMHLAGSHFHTNGQRVFVYACGCCGRQEAYVHHYHTGRPHRLYVKSGP